MTSPSNDMLAIHLHDGLLDLCLRGGSSARLERWTGSDAERAALAAIDEAGLRSGFDCILRCDPSDSAASEVERRLHEAIARRGARSVRLWTSGDLDSGTLAARRAADRNRLGLICTAELSSRSARLAVLNRRGRVLAGESLNAGTLVERACPVAESTDAWRATVAGVLGRLMNRCRRECESEDAAPTLVAYGPDGPMHAAAFAAECGLDSVLIPVNAGALACVGLLAVDSVLELSDDGPPYPFEIAVLRMRFARLMDRAADALSARGYDFDDAVCDRIIGLAVEGDERTIEIEADFLADPQWLIDQFFDRRNEPAKKRDKTEIEIRFARLRVTIDSPHLDLPKEKGDGSRFGGVPSAIDLGVKRGRDATPVPFLRPPF